MSVFRILLVMFSTTVSLPSCPGRMIVPRPDRTFFGTEEPGTASTSTYRRALQVVKDREGNGAERARALKTWCRIGQMQKARACPGIETLPMILCTFPTCITQEWTEVHLAYRQGLQIRQIFQACLTSERQLARIFST